MIALRACPQKDQLNGGLLAVDIYLFWVILLTFKRELRSMFCVFRRKRLLLWRNKSHKVKKLKTKVQNNYKKSSWLAAAKQQCAVSKSSCTRKHWHWSNNCWSGATQIVFIFVCYNAGTELSKSEQVGFIGSWWSRYCSYRSRWSKAKDTKSSTLIRLCKATRNSNGFASRKESAGNSIWKCFWHRLFELTLVGKTVTTENADEEQGVADVSKWVFSVSVC